MKDIESLRYGKSTRNLKKTITNDRSKPMLSQTKIKGKVSYVLFDVGDCVVKNAGHFSQIIGPTSIFSNLEMFSRCFCECLSQDIEQQKSYFFYCSNGNAAFFLLNRANEVLRFNVLSKLTVCVLSTYSS